MKVLIALYMNMNMNMNECSHFGNYYLICESWSIDNITTPNRNRIVLKQAHLIS